MRIALDVMGGDNAPRDIIAGGIRALKSRDDLYLTLVGKSDIINQELKQLNPPRPRVDIVDAPQTIGMDESPARALRKKKNSSINLATKLVNEGRAEAFVSAGNTGAVMAASLFNIGRLPGIKRPSIATLFPGKQGQTLLMDAGANVDCSPHNLLQFSIMGQIYADNVLGISDPCLGLLSIGEEKKKGNQLTKNTFNLLEEDDRIHNFIGNVEGRDIFNDSCDLIICDGFIGNIVLKTTEGVASLMFDILKQIMTHNFLTRMASLILKPYMKSMMSRVDYRQYGGAPLLGVNGVVIISHGSSDATAIKNAIEVAEQTVAADVISRIESEIQKDGDSNDS
ncbi:MAG: phosphate acyltransferase PlsX [Bacillota bacterium]